MKKYILPILFTMILISTNSFAQNNDGSAKDEKAIRQILKNITDSWAAGDGKTYSENFTEDSDFTVWNGMYSKGREANEKGHQQIFDTIYKGTEVRFKVRQIRFLSDEIAVVHLFGEMFRNDESVEDVPKVVPVMILQKKDDQWRIAVFQNTPVIKRGELILGKTTETAKN